MNLNTHFYKPYKDNFNYYNLITKINSGYRLYFNNKTKMFEIINIANFNEICLKFSSFNFDLLKKLQKSSSRFSKNIFDEVEEFNSNLNKKILENHILNSIDELKFQTKYSLKNLLL